MSDDDNRHRAPDDAFDEDDALLNELSFGDVINKAKKNSPPPAAKSEHRKMTVAKLEHETPKAYLIIFKGETEKVWVPKSQVKCDEIGNGSVIEVSTWWCKQNGR